MKLAAFVLAATAVSPAVAQSLNIDFGFTVHATVSTPAPGYGAAAAQPGRWNLVDPLRAPEPLDDLTGVATSVRALGGYQSVGQNPANGIPPGDDHDLMGDFNGTPAPSDQSTWVLTGLRPARYAVYTYAMHPNQPSVFTAISVPGSSEGSQVVGGAWPGMHVAQVTYARHEVSVFHGHLRVVATTVGNWLSRGAVNGIQLVELGPPLLGQTHCHSNPNSTGVEAGLFATGRPEAAQNDVTLRGHGLPPHVFGLFLTAPWPGFLAHPAGSAGNVCLGAGVGRYIGPGQVQRADGAGTIALALDLTRHPTPNGPIAVQPGDTWYFQTWFRDSAGGVSTSNFTSGLQIVFE